MTLQGKPFMVARDMITGTAFCSVIFAATLYMPILGFFISLLLPQPVLYYRLKHGRIGGGVILAATLLIIVLVTGSRDVDTLFYGALLAVGYFIGEYLERQITIGKTVIYSVFTTIGICFAVFVAYALVSGTSFYAIVSEYVANNLKLTLQLYSELGLSEEKIELLSSSLERIQYILVRILPALVTVVLAFVTWINILLIKKILKKDSITMSWLGVLNCWKSPEPLVWFVIFFGILLFVPVQGIKLAALNCFILLMLMYFFQGMAVVSFFFEKKGFPFTLRFLIYALILIQQIFLLLVIGVGFFDTWLNFRKLDTVEN